MATEAFGQLAAPDLVTFQATFGLDDRCVQSLGELSQSDQLIVMDIVTNKQQCNNASAFTWSTVKKIKEQPGAIKLEYLRRHLDARALEGLGQLPLQAQESVAFPVDVTRVRNLSAFTWKQIRSLQQGGQGGNGFPQAPMAPMGAMAGARERSRTPVSVGGNGGATDVMQFLATAGLDPRASEALTSLDPGSQRMVVGLVSRKAPRNISAVTWSMVKLVRERPAEAKIEYLRGALDVEALAALEKLPGDVKESVLGQVDIAQCRNLSAFVWSKVKGHISPPVRHGDLSGGAVAALGIPQQAISGPSPLAGFNVGTDGDPVAMAGFQIDERCLAKLRELSVDAQLLILQSVPENCRNPSAYVWSKVKNSLPPKI